MKDAHIVVEVHKQILDVITVRNTYKKLYLDINLMWN